MITPWPAASACSASVTLLAAANAMPSSEALLCWDTRCWDSFCGTRKPLTPFSPRESPQALPSRMARDRVEMSTLSVLTLVRTACSAACVLGASHTFLCLSVHCPDVCVAWFTSHPTPLGMMARLKARSMCQAGLHQTGCNPRTVLSDFCPKSIKCIA